MMERRKHQRVMIKSVAEVTVLSTNTSQQTFIGGISRGGLEMYSQRPFTVKSDVSIRMTFLNQHAEGFEETLRGVVRWSSKLGEGYLAGIEFSAPIDDADHPSLCAYIAHYVLPS